MDCACDVVSDAPRAAAAALHSTVDVRGVVHQPLVFSEYDDDDEEEADEEEADEEEELA